ncbi:ABC transporter substrate-binding protein [Sulfuricystis multivorans]|uniref:ABC transporter substrate-binding protein n=1 Tax=Sulfuricystis multivorans TaxID=2211108 RepID=UPI000F84CB1B|nr:ABC transporter substrate-binding protein [Sulfuricystis multivorans]
MRRLVTLLGFAALLLGCAPEPQSLLLTVNPWLGYDPFVLARERGLLDPRLRIVEVMSNSDSRRALANGLIEATALTLDEALRAADAGIPIRIVAVLDVSEGADALLARPDIERLDQLEGKRIGVESGAVGSLMLDRLLTTAGLQRDAVQIVAVEASQHAALLQSGRVDAVITFEPMRTQLERRGYRVLFDSRALPGEIIDVLVARPGVDTALLLDTWRVGLTALARDRLAAAEVLAHGVDLSVEEYQQALSGLRFVFPEESARWLSGGKTAPLVERAAAIAEELRHRGEIKRPPEWQILLGRATQ